jgi:hypothetical protein
MIKFSKSNWERFETHNKRTTIRHHELKTGFHTASTGWYKNYSRLGTVYVHPFEKKCMVKELTMQDAMDDGFDSLCELLIELAHLNKALTPETIVFKHPVEKQKVAA